LASALDLPLLPFHIRPFCLLPSPPLPASYMPHLSSFGFTPSPPPLPSFPISPFGLMIGWHWHHLPQPSHPLLCFFASWLSKPTHPLAASPILCLPISGQGKSSIFLLIWLHSHSLFIPGTFFSYLFLCSVSCCPIDFPPSLLNTKLNWKWICNVWSVWCPNAHILENGESILLPNAWSRAAHRRNAGFIFE
jgi:hypothetical protein